MKKCLFSTYIKTEHLPKIQEDIVRFNAMKRTAFSCVKKLGGDCPVKEDQSLQLYLKEQFHVSDYFANSARRDALALLTSAKEGLQRQENLIKDRIKQMEKKVKSTEKRLQRLEKEKESLINRSRTGKWKFASYSGGRESEPSPGNFQVRFGKRVKLYENQHLFEVQYLNPEIRKLKARIRMINQRIASNKCRLEKIHKALDTHSPSICFGSKKLMKSRNTVYANHPEEWYRLFQKRRNHGMTISGRKDAAQGNFVFVYDIKTHALTYRTMNGEYLDIPGVVFPYGQELVDAAVSLPKEERKAIAWRLEIHGSRICVKCMIELPDERTNTYFGNGCIAFDTNVDHLAVDEIDRHGNLLSHTVIPLDLNHKTKGQREQILSNALEQIFQMAKAKCKPIAMERLSDIKQKPMYQQKQLNKKLSEFAYRMVTELAMSKSYKYSIQVCAAHPAYTSQIGKFKYMRRYGLSVHEAAALVIGRRAMGFQEKLPKAMRHLLPDDRKCKHHWSHWSYFTTKLKDIHYGIFYNYINYEDMDCIEELKYQLTTL